MGDEYLSNEEKASLLRDYISKYSKFCIGDKVLDISNYDLLSNYNLNDDYIDELINILIYEQNSNPNLITLKKIFNGDKMYVLKIGNEVVKVYENEEVDKSVGFNILKE